MRRVSCSHLAMHAHDDHSAGVVTNHKVLWILGERDHVVDGDIQCPRQTFKSVDALTGFCVPNLNNTRRKISDFRVAQHFLSCRV